MMILFGGYKILEKLKNMFNVLFIFLEKKNILIIKMELLLAVLIQ